MRFVIRRAWIAAQIILTGAIALPASAQTDPSTVSASFAVTARVVAPLALVVTHPLDFGRMLSGTNKTVAANAATAGQFEISGQTGSNVSVTLSMPSVLLPVSGNGIPVTSWVYVLSTSPSLTGSPVSFNAGAGSPVTATFSGTDGTTKLYFGIGATAQAPTSATATSYTGTGHITAAYSDL